MYVLLLAAVAGIVTANDPTGCGETCNNFPAKASASFDIRDFGAVGDGRTVDTTAIQQAIDAASAHPSGSAQVLVRNGSFLTGLVQLRSNMVLNVAGDGIILGSNRPEDYP